MSFQSSVAIDCLNHVSPTRSTSLHLQDCYAGNFTNPLTLYLPHTHSVTKMTDKTVAEQYFEKFAAAHRTIFELEVTNSTLKSQCAELEKATAALQSRLDEAVLARDQQTTQARTLVDQLQVKESRVAELKRRLEAALVFRAGFDDGDEDSSQPS